MSLGAADVRIAADPAHHTQPAISSPTIDQVQSLPAGTLIPEQSITVNHTGRRPAAQPSSPTQHSIRAVPTRLNSLCKDRTAMHLPPSGSCPTSPERPMLLSIVDISARPPRQQLLRSELSTLGPSQLVQAPRVFIPGPPPHAGQPGINDRGCQQQRSHSLPQQQQQQQQQRQQQHMRSPPPPRMMQPPSTAAMPNMCAAQDRPAGVRGAHTPAPTQQLSSVVLVPNPPTLTGGLNAATSDVELHQPHHSTPGAINRPTPPAEAAADDAVEHTSLEDGSPPPASDHDTSQAPVLPAHRVPSALLCSSVGSQPHCHSETFTARPGVSVQQQQPPPLCSHTPLSVQPLRMTGAAGPMEDGGHPQRRTCNLVGEGGSVPATAGDSSLGSSNISGDGNEPAGTAGSRKSRNKPAPHTNTVCSSPALPSHSDGTALRARVGPAATDASALAHGAEPGSVGALSAGQPARDGDSVAVCPSSAAPGSNSSWSSRRHSALSELSGLFVQRSAGSVNTVIGLHPSYLAFLAAPTAAHTTHLLPAPSRQLQQQQQPAVAVPLSRLPRHPHFCRRRKRWWRRRQQRWRRRCWLSWPGGGCGCG
ncbi:MAG: hypothetical protein WDW36_007072 [Sanguina aurantia]